MSIDVFRPSDIPTGLVGYWKLGETSGTRVDSSSNGNDLTDNNTVGSVAQDYWSTGENSADFESGNSEYLSIADASQTGLDITGSYSVSVWFKAESFAGGYILAKNYTGYGINMTSGDGGTVRVYHAGASKNFITPLSLGKWTHLGVVYDTSADTVSVFINGNLAGTQDQTTDPADVSTQFCLGQRADGADYFDGILKDVAIWNTVLTPIQIKSLAMGVDLSTYAYRPDNVSVSPTAWWKGNETSGNLTDSSGSHTGTDTNTVGSSGGYIEGTGRDYDTGANEYFSVADHTDFDFSGGVWSASAFIKAESLGIYTVFSHPTDSNNYFKFGLTAGGVLFIGVASGGSDIVAVQTASGTIVADTWYHVVWMEDGDSWKIYVDGVDRTDSGGTDVQRASNYTGTVRVGGGQIGTQCWDGVITDLAIWKGYALTDAEIASLASAFPVQQSGIVSYWKLDETSGTRVDSIGSNDLTDNNTVGYGTGKVSNAADFEADNSEYLSVANNASINLTRDITMMCWSKSETNKTTAFLDKDGAGDGYSLRMRSSGEYQIDMAGSTRSRATTVPSTGTWYHGCGIYDGAFTRIFVDSVMEDEDAYSTDPADVTEELTLGKYGSSYADLMQDETILAKRWFRPEEIKTVYIKGLIGEEATSEPNPATSSNTGAFFALL